MCCVQERLSIPVSDNAQSPEKDGNHSEDLWVWRDTLRLGADMREACGDVPPIRLGASSRYGNLILVCPPFFNREIPLC